MHPKAPLYNYFTGCKPVNLRSVQKKSGKIIAAEGKS
jgi:hypothetical protein